MKDRAMNDRAMSDRARGDRATKDRTMTPGATRQNRAPARHAHGFAYIAAVVLLVVMATLATAMLRLNTVQQHASNQDLMGVRATQVARAGVDWGLYQLRTGACNTGGQSLSNFYANSGFYVTVVCSFDSFNEGESAPGTPLVKRVYRIDAVACNLGSPCPNSTQPNSTLPSNVDYVERRRVASVCLTGPVATPIDC
jgi:MSHA biogenesis protein MshP